MSWNRLISVLVAVIYLAIAFAHGGMEPTFKIGMFLILPLACIWFSDAMGGYTGLSGDIWITQSSPGIFVCIAGWILLLLPIIVVIISCFTS